MIGDTDSPILILKLKIASGYLADTILTGVQYTGKYAQIINLSTLTLITPPPLITSIIHTQTVRTIKEAGFRYNLALVTEVISTILSVLTMEVIVDIADTTKYKHI
jgi:hypothetical protein